jgi:hypothetical protein
MAIDPTSAPHRESRRDRTARHEPEICWRRDPPRTGTPRRSDRRQPHPQRHTLHAVACNVFEFVKGGHADAGIRAELERIATANGLPDSEIQSTLRSAWQRVSPRDVPAPKAVTPAYTIEDQTQ